MKRKDFLQSLGIAGAGSVLAAGSLMAKKQTPQHAFPPNCVLIPSETAGPFPLDLTENATFFRQDVRETREGVQLNVKMRILGVNNCEPMANVRVNIWHCDKDGLYSGYSQQNNQGQASQTYLRGYQLTDANGEVEFVTIFPGWYTGRICHIHFQCYVSSMYAAISQFTFPIAEKNALYAAYPALYTKGADPLSFNNDNIFSDGYTYQIGTLTPNAETGGYTTEIEVGIQGSGVTGLGALEPETGGQFKLGVNFPNPFAATTTIPFTLNNAADVELALFNLDGKLIKTVSLGRLQQGEHLQEINLNALNIPSASYVYQLQTSNEHGIYRQCKMMTFGG